MSVGTSDQQAGVAGGGGGDREEGRCREMHGGTTELRETCTLSSPLLHSPTLLSPFCPCSLFLLGPPYRPPPAASNAARYPPGLHQGGGDRETAGIGERTRGGAVDGWERRK